MTRDPSSRRAVRFPAAYGAPGGPDSLLRWSDVEERTRPVGERYVGAGRVPATAWIFRQAASTWRRSVEVCPIDTRML
jgi:hypothetical protein